MSIDGLDYVCDREEGHRVGGDGTAGSHEPHNYVLRGYEKMRTPELPQNPPNLKTFKCSAAHCPMFDCAVKVRMPTVGITMFGVIPVYCMKCGYAAKEVHDG
jgi:hypothetical protein